MAIVRFYQLKTTDPLAYEGLSQYLKERLLEPQSPVSGDSTSLQEPEFTVLMNTTDVRRRWFPLRSETSVDLVVSGTESMVGDLEAYIRTRDTISLISRQTVTQAALVFNAHYYSSSPPKNRCQVYAEQLEELKARSFPNVTLWKSDNLGYPFREASFVITGPIHEVCGFRETLSAPGMVMIAGSTRVLFPYTQQHSHPVSGQPLGRTL
ncbi:hypothetical protein HYW21_01295 [Candidatus Woesearchaeota archaeon]|nr:hypothetical protein [Candidatus Woesearchaeota archaeon]